MRGLRRGWKDIRTSTWCDEEDDKVDGDDVGDGWVLSATP